MRARKTLLPGILLLALLVVAWVLRAPRGQAAPDLTVEIQTEPAASAIVPDETLVQTRLGVLDASGQPVPGVRIALHLDAPPRPKILNTDFPYVEGTSLLDFAADAPSGEVQFATIYPIRGTYTFKTLVTLPDGTTFDAAPTLSVAENPAEVRHFLILLAMLLGFGFLSGLIIGRGHRAASALALFSVLWLVPSATFAHGPDEHNAAGAGPITVSTTDGPLLATLTVAPGSGQVGTLNSLEVRLANPDGSPVDGEVTLQAWHLEDDRPMYAFNLPVRDGEARLQLQFFDGAEHDIRLEARTDDGRSATLHAPIEVQAFSPPLWLKVRVVGLLVGVVALGLIVGLWLGVRPPTPLV